MAECKKCGAELSPGAVACEYCGSMTERPAGAGGLGKNLAGRADVIVSGEAPRFKRSSIFGMLLCTAVTYGFYIGLWHVLRRKSLARLEPAQAQKTSLIVIAFTAASILYLCSRRPGRLQEFAEPLSICFAVMWVYASFTVRGLLRGYAERVSPYNPINASIAGSYIWTLLFGCFYLQTQINRMIDANLFQGRAPGPISPTGV